MGRPARPIDPDAIIDEVAIRLVKRGKRPFSILYWEEQVELYRQWKAEYPDRRHAPSFCKLYGTTPEHAKQIAAAINKQKRTQEVPTP